MSFDYYRIASDPMPRGTVSKRCCLPKALQSPLPLGIPLAGAHQGVPRDAVGLELLKLHNGLSSREDCCYEVTNMHKLACISQKRMKHMKKH